MTECGRIEKHQRFFIQRLQTFFLFLSRFFTFFNVFIFFWNVSASMVIIKFTCSFFPGFVVK